MNMLSFDSYASSDFDFPLYQLLSCFWRLHATPQVKNLTGLSWVTGMATPLVHLNLSALLDDSFK
jgi:hypothetical protein